MIVSVGDSKLYALVDSGLRLAATSVPSGGPPRPVLLLSSQDCPLDNPSAIIKKIRELYENDDVFDEAFVSETLLIGDVSPSERQRMVLSTELPDEIVLNEKHWDLKFVENVDIFGLKEPVWSGPYFLSGAVVFKPFRLYTDEFACFQTTVLPTRLPYRFKNLNAIAPNGEGMCVAVPSRRHGQPPPDKPLSGYRIGIKDNISLAGIKTSLGNRSFLSTYDEEQETAAFITGLIDKGSYIAGKTRMAAFASGEKPIDFFDFKCPFNVRADGYLEPGSSSTGSAAAAAAYPFLDVLIGTDTNGSVREPAARCGVYAIRVSTGLWGPTTGLYPCSPVFDTVGAFARDLKMLQSFSRAALGPTVKEFMKDAAQQKYIDQFLQILESFLGIKKTPFSLAQGWAENPPAEANGKSLNEYAFKTGYNPFYYDIYHQYDQFRADHLEKFGSKAYVSPSMQWRLDRGAEITESEVEQSHKELKVLQAWFAKSILRGDHTAGSTAVLILPVGPTEPNYRDAYILPSPRLGIDALSLASFMKMPQLVVPVGQVEYDSRVSGRKESFPICSSIAGAHGSDLMIIDLALKALKHSKFPTKVATGRYAFPPS
ncbi:amidase signature domain-containing protein [Immersiella caudata]|uniref:Amidase signature domain-containing protein n=1 Tax=Immersiella caudata TaxID=314043 RepID=A0AA39U3V7_9PEZI|nr:amidase signature domain-containing protein [Immersiella caudata]